MHDQGQELESAVLSEGVGGNGGRCRVVVDDRWVHNDRWCGA
jgi:hypothetical protein